MSFDNEITRDKMIYLESASRSIYLVPNSVRTLPFLDVLGLSGAPVVNVQSVRFNYNTIEFLLFKILG